MHKDRIVQPSGTASAGSAKPLRALTQVGDRVDEAALQQADWTCLNDAKMLSSSSIC